MSDISERPSLAHIRREPLTYDRWAPHSYFRDLFLANDRELRNRYPDAAARQRRHAEEIDAIAAEPNSVECRAYRKAGVELRVTPNRTLGTGGYFAVPLWLISQFATAPRAGRVLANLMPQFPLPAGYSSVNVPRITAGTAQGNQSDNAATPETDVTDSASQRTVATISGYTDWPLQALEQSPPGAHIDWVMYKDMGEAYDAQLEGQLMNGTGTGNQILGLLNVPASANQITYTSGTPTLAAMYGPIGQLAAAIGKNRKLPPEAWLMTTARWAWIGSSEDSQGRPIVPPDVHPPLITDDSGGAVSTDLGWAVYCDDAIPTNLGAGGNQDTIICCRPSDMLLLESEPRVQTSREALAGTLGVRFRLHRYVDAITDRYPTAVATLTGTGMVTQTGF